MSFGVPVNWPAVLDTTAPGAAFVAGLGVGFWTSPDAIADVRRTERIFTPAMSDAARGERLDGWRAAVRRVLSAS